MPDWEKTSESRIARFIRRIVICLGAALLLDVLLFLTVDYVRYPDFLLRILFLPGQIYCYYLSITETLPSDDIPLFEAGRAIDCYLTGLSLNIPYYTLLLYGAWQLLEKLKLLNLR